MAEQQKNTGAITQTTPAGTSTAVKTHKDRKGPSVKETVGQAIDYVKKNTPRGTALLVGLAVVAVAVGLLFRYFYLSSEATASARWLRLDQATFLAEVAAVADDAELKNTEQARMAKFLEARMKLDSGLKRFASSKEEALQDLESARQIYEELAKTSGRVPLLHQEALAGAARANESLGRGVEATQFYERLAKDHPSSAAGKDAKKQIERLASPAGKKALEEISNVFNLKGAGG